MDGLLRKHRGIFLTCVIGLIALISISYLIRLPAVQAGRGLKLLAATQVGQTTADDFRKMAARSGVRLEETSNTFGVLQRNRLLEYLHLAPPTVVLMNAQVVAGVVNAISVRAWIGTDREFAKISIDERDSHQTSCGDVPLCVQPTSSTTTTYVFFRPSTPIAQKEQLLSLNVRCLSKVEAARTLASFFLLRGSMSSHKGLPQMTDCLRSLDSTGSPTGAHGQALMSLAGFQLWRRV